MINNFLKLIYRRIWPSHKNDLLIRTFLGESQKSSMLWDQWTSQYDFESLNWEDQKLLVRIAPLLSHLFPNSVMRPRIEGIAKSHWTRSQILLKSSAQAVEVLKKSGIPLVILKGAAMQAYGFKTIGPRICSDLDLMVKLEDFPSAIEALYEQNWKSKNSISFAKTIWQFSSGINLRKAPYGDIDVHHQPVGIRVMPKDVINSIWMRTNTKDFLGQQVLTPGLVDMIVILACHALKDYRKAASGVWIFDLMTLINAGIDGSELKHVANEYKARLPVMAILSYAYQVTGDKDAKRLLRDLEDAPISINEIFYFLIDSSQTSGMKVKVFIFKLLKWLMRIVDNNHFRMKIPKFYPIWLPNFLLKPIDEQSSTSCLLRHRIDLPKTASALKLSVAEITFTPNVARKYQFDLTVDGKFISRLRANVSQSKCNKSIHLRFVIPFKPQSRVLEMESLNTNSLMSDTSNKYNDANQAIPFSVRFFGVRAF